MTFLWVMYPSLGVLQSIAYLHTKKKRKVFSIQSEHTLKAEFGQIRVVGSIILVLNVGLLNHFISISSIIIAFVSPKTSKDHTKLLNEIILYLIAVYMKALFFLAIFSCSKKEKQIPLALMGIITNWLSLKKCTKSSNVSWCMHQTI